MARVAKDKDLNGCRYTVTPMPPMAYFLAKVAMAVLFGTIIIALIAGTGVLLAGIPHGGAGAATSSNLGPQRLGRWSWSRGAVLA